MRALIILALLAGAGYGGWYWLSHRSADATEADPFDSQAAVTAQAAPLPAAAQKAWDEAEALWSAAGGQAAQSQQAPRMARLYTQALQAMYNLPGNHDREAKLIAERLQPLGEALFFTKARFGDDPSGLMGVHVVAPGENPDAIARALGMSRELLNRLRGKDVNDANLRAGETLKIVKVKEKGGFQLHIDLSDYVMDLTIGGVFAKRYIISHGAKESPTPTGRTALTDRVWHPQWTHPQTKKVMPYGDPENILGPIWLPFDAKQLGQNGIGIHGYTGADAKMQAMVSNGCIRLQNQDAEELYQLISSPQRAPTTVENVP
jgi:lipoprotein-anchoring transpeptidase ErfK/SrfK